MSRCVCQRGKTPRAGNLEVSVSVLSSRTSWITHPRQGAQPPEGPRIMRTAALVIALASTTVSAFSAAPHVLYASAPGVRLGAPASHRPGSACATRERGQKLLLSMESSATGKPPSSRRASTPADDQNRRRFLASGVCAALLVVTASPAEAKEAINDCEKWASGRRWLTGAYVLLRAGTSKWIDGRAARTFHLRIPDILEAPSVICGTDHVRFHA